MSAIPDIRRWLTDQMKAHTAFAGTFVSYGYEDADEDTFGIVLGPDPEDTEWVALGNDQLDDYFSIGVLLQAVIPGDSAEDADRRVDSFFDAVREIVAAGRTMGGLLVMPAKVAIGEWTSAPAGEGYGCRVQLRVRCRTRS
jgi:hypothetical protein